MKSALAHVKTCSGMADVEERILVMCSKDLISSEVKSVAGLSNKWGRCES